MEKEIYRKNKGQSLVETALMLPVVLLLLTGIIDFGMMFNNYLIVSNASREGARAAAIGSTDVQIDNVVDNAAVSLDSSNLTVTIDPTQAEGRKSGDTVTVTVRYRHSMMTPIIAAIFPGPVDLDSSTSMRCE